MRQIIIPVIIGAFIAAMIACENPTEPETVTKYKTNTVYVTNGPVIIPDSVTFVDDIVGVWHNGNADHPEYQITNGAYVVLNPPNWGWDYAAEIVYTNEAESYFIIHITNHSASSNQIGNYTRVHWNSFYYLDSNETKSMTLIAEAHPQTNSLGNARDYQSAETHISSWGDFFINF